MSALSFTARAAFGIAMAFAPLTANAATEGKRVSLKGELIDTWCYFSGVMGSPDGMLGEDGDVYMILKLPDDDNSAGGDTFVELTNDTIEAEGMMYERDGLKYLVVSEVTSNDGVANLTHEEVGVIPGFTIPKKVRKAVLGE